MYGDYTKSSAIADGLRDALVNIEKSLLSMNDIDIHPRSSQLLLLDITSCLWTVVSTSISRTVYKTLSLWSERDCIWPSELLHFWQQSLNYKTHELSNLCVKYCSYIALYLWDIAITKISDNKKWLSNSLKDRNHDFRRLAHIWLSICLPL